MDNRKKLQIFISSTYKDLLDERQSAVEAILKAGHIPAGMELFTASNQSQWEIIKRWIDESDVYMLILGGRYGSIDKETGKSYTHLEYEYAQSKNKPLFAVVIDDSKLENLPVNRTEKDNPDKLLSFRNKVLSYMCRFFTDTKDIKLAIHESLGQINQDYELTGWIRGNNKNSEIADEIVLLNDEIRALRKENETLKKSQQERKPKLKLSINNTDNPTFNSDLDESIDILFKEKPLIDSIPNHLKKYISEREKDSYNRSLSSITKESIEEYNSIQANIYELMTLRHPLNINLLNDGNIKANNIHIYITFPDIVSIADKTDKDLINDNLDKLNNESKDVLPKSYFHDLIEEAQNKYDEDITAHIKPNALSFLNRIPLNSHEDLILRDNRYINNLKAMSLGNNINSNMVKDNTISITKSELLHNLNANYDNYVLIPLRSGNADVTVKIICEEYLEPEIFQISISVKTIA
ncbi:DUF4062 domain-containing protein [Psychrobacter raelei]|uniref:DUF4062 domain-containing protein n=1 Tax=Psychrobacter raelei TaxID=2565531 RepID=A0AAU6PTY7_9GAMM